MLTNQRTRNSGGGNRPRLSLKIADVEYRIRWDEASQAWDVLRNGAVTAVAARKKKSSAVASAIRDAKAESETSTATFAVTCFEDGKVQTLWKTLRSL